MSDGSGVGRSPDERSGNNHEMTEEIVKKERIGTSKSELRRCLVSVPKGSKVA